MILPLLVFLVVLIAVLISFKKEHFTNGTTSSTTSQSSSDNETIIKFLIDNSSGNYSRTLDDSPHQTTLSNAIKTAFIGQFNDIELDDTMFIITYNSYNLPTPSVSAGSTTPASLELSEVIIYSLLLSLNNFIVVFLSLNIFLFFS